jgi:hypothetical protein
MTAEIVIMNKESVAMAADSAVTLMQEKGQKIFISANKLFTLSKYHPVGIMVYGNATFMGIPWETIIKNYRQNLGKKKFDTVDKWAKDFINFFQNNTSIFTHEIQNIFGQISIYSFFNLIKEKIIKKVETLTQTKGEGDNKDVKSILDEIVGEYYKKNK